jgi:hypothetical protein
MTVKVELQDLQQHSKKNIITYGIAVLPRGAYVFSLVAARTAISK